MYPWKGSDNETLFILSQADSSLWSYKPEIEELKLIGDVPFVVTINPGTYDPITGDYYILTQEETDSYFCTRLVKISFAEKLPTATTSAATSVSSTSATLNGTVNPNGASTTVTFEYGTTTSYGNAVTASQSPLSGSSAQSVSANVSGLTPGSAYHFRVKATNSAGTSYGSDVTFTTAPLSTVPTVTTGPAIPEPHFRHFERHHQPQRSGRAVLF